MDCFSIVNRADVAEVLLYEDIAASSSGSFVRQL